jgi:uncharacterized delta-60 repeat protein
MKSLEKDRNHRYETANGLAADLKRHLRNEPVVARPPNSLYKLQKAIQRNRVPFAAVGAVTAVLVLGLGIAVWQVLEKSRAYRRAQAAEAAARLEAAKSRQVADLFKKMVDVTVTGSATWYSVYWLLLRLNTDGSVDATFPVREYREQSNSEQQVVEMADGKLLVVEYALPAGEYRLATRLNPDGSQDTTFTNLITANGSLEVTPLPDGKMLVNGYAWSPQLSGSPIPKLSRLNNDGSLDPTFTAPASLPFLDPLWRMTNDQILAKTLTNPSFGVWTDKLFRLNENGSLDGSFTVGTAAGPPHGHIAAVIRQTDGKLVVAGGFRTYNGQVCNSIVRLNPDGSIDATFQSGSGFLSANAPGNMSPPLELAGGQMLFENGFDTYNGESIPNHPALQTSVILLNADGTRDPALTDQGSYIPNLFEPENWGFVSYVRALYAHGHFVGSPSFYVPRRGAGSPFFVGTSVLGRFRIELALRLVSTRRDGDGTTRLLANALPDRSYTLQASENLANWSDLATQIATTNRIEFTEAPTNSHSLRFYRLKRN